MSRGKSFTGSRSLGVLLALSFVLSTAAAQAHGDFHTLIADTDKEIEKDPKNPALYLQRGELYRIHQQYDSAQADIALAEALAPALPSLDLARGRLLFDTGWPLAARSHLDRFLKAMPNHVEALVLRSRVWTALGQPLYAADDYSHAIFQTPEGAPDLYIERAHSLASNGPDQIDAALRGLDDGIKRMGPLVTLQLTAIDLELRRQNYDNALARVDTVMARSPRKETWLARKGEIFLQAGRPDDAKQAYTEALSALGTLPPARRNVPAVADLEARIRQELKQFAPGTAPPKP